MQSSFDDYPVHELEDLDAEAIATCLEVTHGNFFAHRKFQVGLGIFAIVLSIFMLDVGARIQFGAGCVTLTILVQLTIPRVAAYTACAVLLVHGAFLVRNALGMSPEDIALARQKVEGSALGIATVWTCVGVWFALQPSAYISMRTKLFTAAAFEALQLYDIAIRYSRTGDVQVVTVALLYSDCPFCLSFLATLGAMSAARGRAWRRALESQVKAAQLSDIEKEEAAATHRQLAAEHTQLRADHHKVAEQHRQEAQKNQLLQEEVGSARALARYDAFNRSRTAWAVAVRDRAPETVRTQTRRELNRARDNLTRPQPRV